MRRVLQWRLFGSEYYVQFHFAFIRYRGSFGIIETEKQRRARDLEAGRLKQAERTWRMLEWWRKQRDLNAPAGGYGA